MQYHTSSQHTRVFETQSFQYNRDISKSLLGNANSTVGPCGVQRRTGGLINVEGGARVSPPYEDMRCPLVQSLGTANHIPLCLHLRAHTVDV